MKGKNHELSRNSRRAFLQKGSLLLAGTVAFSGMAISCEQQHREQENHEAEEGEEEMVSANEDLMREHGLLNRILLIYDTAITRLKEEEAFNPAYLNRAAGIVHDFVEDYHEKLEEEYLFPRLEKANKLTDLTATLRRQHAGGRKLTEKVLELTKAGRSIKGEDSRQLISSLTAFNKMYRPHEAREDTVLFPTFKKVISRHEYDALGEEFEKKEHEKFGKDGFMMMLDKVAEIEKQMGIFDLNQFTPGV